MGGEGTAACSGDLLLGALAACAQVTCQMIAASSGLPVEAVRVHVEGDLDLRGTLGLSRAAPVGFAAIRVRFELDAPTMSERDRAALARRTEQYCTVIQTLLSPPPVEVTWSSDGQAPAR
ncbi:MAG: OsmC family protein [Dehalococcoidia bacterium]